MRIKWRTRAGVVFCERSQSDRHAYSDPRDVLWIDGRALTTAPTHRIADRISAPILVIQIFIFALGRALSSPKVLRPSAASDASHWILFDARNLPFNRFNRTNCDQVPLSPPTVALQRYKLTNVAAGSHVGVAIVVS